MKADSVPAIIAGLNGSGARYLNKPRVPVRIEDFADPELRASWIRDKGMVVFQLVSDDHPETPVDVFGATPFDFGDQYARAVRHPVLGGPEAPVLALDELLEMKRQVARAKDLVDVDELSRMYDLPPS